jgi:hypothetical protein
MSTYCFVTDDGEVLERQYPIGMCPHSVSVDGKYAVRSHEHEWNRSSTMRSVNPWAKHRSVSLGVSPSQVKEAEKWHAERGVPTRFNDQGEALITSAKHQRDVCRIRGLFNKDANWSPENV